MKRLFWVGVGAAIGVSATRKVHQATARAGARANPANLGASLGDGLRELGAGLGAFGAEVRAGMAEREDELRALVQETTEIPISAGPVPPGRGAHHAADDLTAPQPRASRRGAGAR